MPPAHTEDQQAQGALTQPLPAGEEVERPASGLFAEHLPGNHVRTEIRLA